MKRKSKTPAIATHVFCIASGLLVAATFADSFVGDCALAFLASIWLATLIWLNGILSHNANCERAEIYQSLAHYDSKAALLELWQIANPKKEG